MRPVIQSKNKPSGYVLLTWSLAHLQLVDVRSVDIYTHCVHQWNDMGSFNELKLLIFISVTL